MLKYPTQRPQQQAGEQTCAPALGFVCLKPHSVEDARESPPPPHTGSAADNTARLIARPQAGISDRLSRVSDDLRTDNRECFDPRQAQVENPTPLQVLRDRNAIAAPLNNTRHEVLKCPRLQVADLHHAELPTIERERPKVAELKVPS